MFVKQRGDGTVYEYAPYEYARYPYAVAYLDAIYIHQGPGVENCMQLMPHEFEMVRAAMLDTDQRREAYAKEELGRRAVEQAERLGR